MLCSGQRRWLTAEIRKISIRQGDNENGATGSLLVGGTIELDPAEVDFERTYTFESGEGGKVTKWTGVRPERGRDGRAVFVLPGIPLGHTAYL